MIGWVVAQNIFRGGKMRLQAVLSIVLACCAVDEHVVDEGQSGTSIFYERDTHPPQYYVDGYTFTDPATVIPVADLREVALVYEDSDISTYLVHVDHVRRFTDASIKLHYDPGVNPHNGGKAARIKSVAVSVPRFDGPYWWTTPSLDVDEDNMFQNGAMIISWTVESTWSPEKGWHDSGNYVGF
ncbi:MAG: hypothetical protein ABIA47_03210 [bacterium]